MSHYHSRIGQVSVGLGSRGPGRRPNLAAIVGHEVGDSQPLSVETQCASGRAVTLPVTTATS